MGSVLQGSSAPTTFIYRRGLQPVTRGTPTAHPPAPVTWGTPTAHSPGPVTRGHAASPPLWPNGMPLSRVTLLQPVTPPPPPARHTCTCGVPCPIGASLSLHPPTTSASSIPCGTGSTLPRPDHPRHYTDCSKW
ncbi:hypothetical protein PIB30_058082 [Stylosanthes scabra]|uniref:Uncharacterized protein n=1 Tax=Stylosanthes scabra TaxID=79078 RepID=A0ABU6TJM3_9FABA|nr:hypothetical protein [Stylosanthes scabra]